MTLGIRLSAFLEEEKAAGNDVQGYYENAFMNCKLLVVLTKPFLVRRDDSDFPNGIDIFVNHDSHYPVGKGYRDKERNEILFAPF